MGVAEALVDLQNYGQPYCHLTSQLEVSARQGDKVSVLQGTSFEQMLELARQAFGSGAATTEWLAQPVMADREDMLGTGHGLVNTLLVQLGRCDHV